MLNIFLVLAFKLLLDFIFLYQIAPLYSYEPYFAFGETNPAKWTIATVLTVLIWAYVRSVVTREAIIAKFFILAQYFILVVPHLVLFGAQDKPSLNVALLCGTFVLLTTIVGLAPRLHIRPPPRTIAHAATAIGLAFSLYVYLGLLVSGGLSRLNFNLYSVYDARSAYISSMLPGFGYLTSWVANTINSAFLIFFFCKKRWGMVGGLVAAQLLLFGMTNFKSFLFVPFAALCLVGARQYLSLPRLMLTGLICGAIVGLAVNAVGEPMGIAIVRRALFVPAALHDLYFDYFSSMPYSQLAGSRFSSIFSTPYEYSAVSAIAYAFWGVDFSPNVGWIGDAYAQFGLLGVAAYTVILGLLLKIADSMASPGTIPEGALEGLLVGSALSLCSTGLPTWFLTHGFTILIIAIWVLNYYFEDKPSTAS